MSVYQRHGKVPHKRHIVFRQHIAVATDDIVFTISEMRKRGVEFLLCSWNLTLITFKQE